MDEHVAATLRANGDDLLRYFARRLPTDEAADALGDLMLVAWRRAAVVPRDSLEARLWLFGVARNIALRVRRGHERRSRLTSHLKSALRAMPRRPEGADEHLEVRDAVERLEPEDAELVRLLHWDGFSLEEVSKVLGISASATRSRYQRVRRLLREQLDPTEGALR